MTECLAKKKGMSMRSNTSIGMDLILYAKVAWERVVKYTKGLPRREAGNLQPQARLRPRAVDATSSAGDCSCQTKPGRSKTQNQGEAPTGPGQEPSRMQFRGNSLFREQSSSRV